MFKRYFVVGLLIVLSFSMVGCSVVPHSTSVVTDDQSGTLVFHVQPEDADIFVDGQYMGEAYQFNGKKRKIKLSNGEHVVELKKKGYKDVSRRFYISDSEEEFRVIMTLEEKEGGEQPHFLLQT